MAYDLSTSTPGVFSRHDERCPLRDGGLCTCRVVTYRATSRRNGSEPGELSPEFMTIAEARVWQRGQDQWVDAAAEDTEPALTDLIDDFLTAAGHGDSEAWWGRPYTDGQLQELRSALRYADVELGGMPARLFSRSRIQGFVAELAEAGVPHGRIESIGAALNALADYGSSLGVLDGLRAEASPVGRYGEEAFRTPYAGPPNGMASHVPMYWPDPSIPAQVPAGGPRRMQEPTASGDAGNQGASGGDEAATDPPGAPGDTLANGAVDGAGDRGGGSSDAATAPWPVPPANTGWPPAPTAAWQAPPSYGGPPPPPSGYPPPPGGPYATPAYTYAGYPPPDATVPGGYYTPNAGSPPPGQYTTSAGYPPYFAVTQNGYPTPADYPAPPQMQTGFGRTPLGMPSPQATAAYEANYDATMQERFLWWTVRIIVIVFVLIALVLAAESV